MCDAVYLNRLDNFKQWYTPYDPSPQGKTIVKLNTVILTKVKVQPINYAALTTIASDKLKGNVIRLGEVYVCDNVHDEILETKFQGEN